MTRRPSCLTFSPVKPIASDFALSGVTNWPGWRSVIGSIFAEAIESALKTSTGGRNSLRVSPLCVRYWKTPARVITASPVIVPSSSRRTFAIEERSNRRTSPSSIRGRSAVSSLPVASSKRIGEWSCSLSHSRACAGVYFSRAKRIACVTAPPRGSLLSGPPMKRIAPSSPVPISRIRRKSPGCRSRAEWKFGNGTADPFAASSSRDAREERRNRAPPGAARAPPSALSSGRR